MFFWFFKFFRFVCFGCFETMKQIEKYFLVFAKQPEKQPKQIELRFVLVQPKIFFVCFEDTCSNHLPTYLGELWVLIGSNIVFLSSLSFSIF
jgi:hypothetical protein